MKRHIVIFLLTFVCFLSGCGYGIERPPSEADQKEEISEFSGTYVGDNSSVYGLLLSLPGGEAVDQLELTDQVLAVTYKGGGQDDSFWNEAKVKEAFMYNAIYTAILVPNAKGYQFAVGENVLQAEPDKLRTWVMEHIGSLPEDLMNDEHVKAYVEQHAVDIAEAANSTQAQTSFYRTFPME
ncbi:DUF4825 domain-containing protein [Bacillaceae bacterium SIJ1]|uniref:DUF4825 domain-containing protein n=1 Tax=Litoribacterium kuwaitense TaxID=1398745 RepID=UPI0013EA22F6|nr:DUF4825 domain-containing protein [Litoribacterium kuwaitense]NGP45927.1 DUF4825 domain-containing protein [Litoribacterium kuwaitense]